MPPNPNVSAEFRHHLSAEQAASTEAAITAGRPVDTRGEVLRNILQAYEEPSAALQALADGRATMEVRWSQLETIKNAGGLGQQQREEYERLERQIKGNQLLEASVPTAYQRQGAEELISYQTMEMPELAGVVNNLKERQQQANAARDAARRAAGPGYATNPDYMRANAAAQAIRTRLQQAENVFNQRDQPNRDAQAQRQQEATRQVAAQREQERQAEEARVRAQREELERLDVRGLRNEITRLGTQVTDLQARRTARAAAGVGAEELAEIDRDIARAQERNTAADRILGNKLTVATEDINADSTLAAENNFIARATNVQILDEIRVREGTANDLRTNLENFRDEYDDPVTTPVRKRELENIMYDTVQQLRREEEVLRLYQNEISKSNKEFRFLKPEQRAEELTKLANEIDIALYNVVDINARLTNNENVTKEEMAAWAKSTVTNLVEQGRAGVDMAQLNRILTTRPELRLALAKGFENSEQARKLIGEKMPTNWQKMWRFAGKHQGWLMILLAILAGATAGAAALAGPIVATAVPASAAGGAAVYGRRG